MRDCGAILDRVWHFPASLAISGVHTLWAQTANYLDHALIFVDLPPEAGIGFAGACRERLNEPSPARMQVDLVLLAKRRDEWAMEVSNRLMQLKGRALLQDPFSELSLASQIAKDVALELAPRPDRAYHPARRRQAFAFGGHRALQREINWLADARRLVKAAADNDTALTQAPEWRYLWQTQVVSLWQRLRRSVALSPPEIKEDAQHYLRDPHGRLTLHAWLGSALDAIRTRQAIMQYAFERAMESNLRRLRGRVRASPQLTSDMLQAALGKAPPQQRVWGISGQAPIGAELGIPPPDYLAALEWLCTFKSTPMVQRVAGSEHGLQLWFRGPRLLGDFIVEWCMKKYKWSTAPLRLLNSPDSYVAIMPDDMLAMQELCLARQGMASTSQCPQCSGQDMNPIVASALNQPRGSEKRAIRYFCATCYSVHDKVSRGPEPPCPIPETFWASLRKFPENMPPFLSRPMDMPSLQARLRKLPKGRAPGRDGIPYEFFKYGPRELHDYLLAAVNAFMAGTHALPDDWLGGCITMVPKSQGATTMKQLRPIVNLSSAYKVCAVEVTDRMMRNFEAYGVWHESQEGARRGRGTRRQIYKVLEMLDEGRRRKVATVVILLDFNAAFNSTNQIAVQKTLEAYGVPQEDLALLKRMEDGSWYSIESPFGTSAACELNRGRKQGCPKSPPDFVTALDPLLRLVSASGQGWAPSNSTPLQIAASGRALPRGQRPYESDPAAAFVDDLTIVTMGVNALQDASALIRLVEVYEEWSGITVNLAKSLVAAIDYSSNRAIDTASLVYRSCPLPVQPVDRPFRLLGVLLTMTLDHSFEKSRVLRETESRVAMLSNATFLTPTQRELAVKLAVVSVFRYSAGLVPWTSVELDDLTKLWVSGYREAWNLPSSDAALFRLSNRHGGRGCPSAHEIWIIETLSLIRQCLAKPGVVASLMTQELQRACIARGCLSLYQLQRMARLVHPRNKRSRIELLVHRIDGLGLDVQNQIWEPPDPRLLLLSEAIWPHTWEACKAEIREGRSGPARAAANLCSKAVSKLAAAGTLFAAQICTGDGLWATRSSLPADLANKVTAREYDALVSALQGCTQGTRICAERRAVPGWHQRTLAESTNKASQVSEVTGHSGHVDPPCAPHTRAEPCASLRNRLHPWQYAPRLPDVVEFDFSSDEPQTPPAPNGWTLLKRNGRLAMRTADGLTYQCEAAQVHMMLCKNADAPAVTTYEAISAACADQLRQDAANSVHWNRHLLARVARITRARGLIGCRSVTFHPHFWWYSSPTASDEALGSVRDWPADCAVLLLDAFSPEERPTVLRRAAGHAAHIWIMRLVVKGETATRDHQRLVDLKAQLYARLPERRLTIHDKECWAEAMYDARPARGITEIWRLGRANVNEYFLSASSFANELGEWKEPQEDFHWPAESHPADWEHYRSGQQDSVQDTWDGLVAAVDGSMDRKQETMGAGVVVGNGREGQICISFPVGGPLSSLRPEAASLHRLLGQVPSDAPLLVFTDCLILLSILAKWGQEDFWPDPEEIKHFDIIEPCLQLLRGRQAVTRLVKVKSHSGLLMNERADALAELGRASDMTPSWQGPRKYDPLGLSARPSIRETYAPFPDRNVADKVLVKRAVEASEREAACRRGTLFSQEMLNDPSSQPVLSVIASQPDSTVRLWMQTVCGLYPTMTRLHKISREKHPTKACPWCGAAQETLSHFLTVCAKFKDARTAAHNRAWDTIIHAVKRAAPPSWKFLIETPMDDTGLLRAQVRGQDGSDVARVAQELQRFARWRPDAVAINETEKKIALLDLTRPYDGCDWVHPGPEPSEGPDGGAQPNDDSFDVDDLAAEIGRSGGRKSISLAAERKVATYGELAVKLRLLRGAEWRVEVLPWVVGVRGVVDGRGILSAMKFLDIPTCQRGALVKTTVVASIHSLEYVHRVRISANPRAIPTIDEPAPSVTTSRKRRPRGEEPAVTMQRWMRLITDPMRMNFKRVRWRGSG